MFRFVSQIVILALATVVPLSAYSRGVTPYLPLTLAPDIERAIERVLILGDKSILTRPIAAATVLEALPRACSKDPVVCVQVRNYLQRYMRRIGLTDIAAELRTSSGADTPIPNARGQTTSSGWSAHVAGYIQPSDYLLASFGANAFQSGGDHTTDWSGTTVSLGSEYFQIDAGYRDHWWSPLFDSSMLLSSNAPAYTSFTISNYKPLTGLGLRYEAFIGKLSDSDSIAYQGQLYSGRPRLAGIHLEIEPASGWSLGASRLFQYGGGPRPSSTHGLLRAFFNPAKYDNANPGSPEQFGNQLASFTSRFIFPGATPFSVYFEYAGEDTSRGKNYLLGNSALSAGIFIPLLWQRFDLNYEVSEWQNAWYVNGLYGDGFTNKGFILGHWGAQQRVTGDAVGAQSHFLSVGAYDVFGGSLTAHYRTLRNESYTNQSYQRAHEIGLRYTKPIRTFEISAEGTMGKDVFGESYAWFGGSVRFGNEPYESIASQGDVDTEREDGAEMFLDTGINVSHLQVELGDAAYGIQKFGPMTGVHVGLGARRAVGAHHDLGVRAEADQIDGHLLLAVRALDYRYRAGRHLAYSLFLGAARYSLATPAYGLYLGAGAQWRDLLPRWDLNFDLRYGDAIARDKVLPGEVAGYQPDNFYDLVGGTLSFSYRW